MDIASVCNDTFEISNPKRLLGRDAPSRARKRIREGDVLVATTRPYLKSIARVPAQLHEQVCSTGFCVLRPTSTVISDWLYFAVLADDFVGQLTSKMRGANYPAVTDADVLDSLIPAPPVPEQRRIVARINECLEKVAEIAKLRSEALQEAYAVLPSVLNEVFTAQAGACAVQTIAEVAVETRYGTSEKCHPEPAGMPILRIPNVAEGAVNLDDLKYCHLEGRDAARVQLQDGDLLFVRTNGSRDLVGRSAVFTSPRDGRPYGFASYLIRVRVDKNKVLPRYLSYFLNSTNGRAEIDSRRRTSAGQFNINSENLRSISFPVPSIAIQQQLLEQLDQREAHAKQLVTEMSGVAEEGATIREAILRKAFAGEL